MIVANPSHPHTRARDQLPPSYDEVVTTTASGGGGGGKGGAMDEKPAGGGCLFKAVGLYDYEAADNGTRGGGAQNACGGLFVVFSDVTALPGLSFSTPRLDIPVLPACGGRRAGV